MHLHPRTVLLVEDNEDDIFFFQRAFKKNEFTHALQLARDGREAVDYLAGCDPAAADARSTPPFVVFLDLKLPLMHGLDLLKWIRSHSLLTHLTVVVLTSSAEPRDISRARELAASAFLVKPPSAASLAQVMATLDQQRAEPTFSISPLACPGNLLLLEVDATPARSQA